MLYFKMVHSYAIYECINSSSTRIINVQIFILKSSPLLTPSLSHRYLPQAMNEMSTKNMTFNKHPENKVFNKVTR
jgi:hypothetical protein